MEGIQFVVNGKGKKTNVLIDLEKYGNIWEEFYDRVLIETRKDEPRESLSSVREKLKQQGKLNA